MNPRSRLLMRLRFFGLVVCAMALSLVSVRLSFPTRHFAEISTFALWSAAVCVGFASCLTGLVYCVLFWLMGNMRNANPVCIAQALASVIPLGLIAPSLTFMLFRVVSIQPPTIPISGEVFPWLVGTFNMAAFVKSMPPTKERITQWRYYAMVAGALLASSYLGSSLTVNDLFLVIPGLGIAWLLGAMGLAAASLKTYLIISVYGTFLGGIMVVAEGVLASQAMVFGALTLVLLIALCGVAVGNHLCEVDATIARPAWRRHAGRSAGGRHRLSSHAMPSPSPSISGR